MFCSNSCAHVCIFQLTLATSLSSCLRTSSGSTCSSQWWVLKSSGLRKSPVRCMFHSPYCMSSLFLPAVRLTGLFCVRTGRLETKCWRSGQRRSRRNTRVTGTSSFGLTWNMKKLGVCLVKVVLCSPVECRLLKQSSCTSRRWRNWTALARRPFPQK